MTDHRVRAHEDGHDEQWTQFEILFMDKVADRLTEIERNLSALIERKLDTIINKLTNIREGQKTMAQDLSTLTAAVASEGTVVDSAIVLLNGIAAALADAIANGADPAAVQAVVDSITAKSSELAAAVAQNTPAAP